MKKTIISLSVATMFGSSIAHAVYTPTVTTTSNNFTMVSASNGLTGGTNDVTFTWDGTFRTAVVTDKTNNATLSSPTAFSGKIWTAHHVNVYAPGTYTFYTDCTIALTPTCGLGTPYVLTVGPGQVGAHMLFNWSSSTNIDVVLLWDMNKSWAGTGTASAFNTGGSNTVNTVWGAVSIDTSIDADNYSGTQMVDGPFIGQSANFNINGVYAPVIPTVSSTVPANDTMGATPVSASTTTTYMVAFNEPMDPATITTAFLAFNPSAGVSVTGVTPTSLNNVFTFDVSGLKSATNYTVTLDNANLAKADASNANYDFVQTTKQFTTAPVTMLTSPSVANDVNNKASLGTGGTMTFSVTFSEPMDPSTVTSGFLSFSPAPVIAVGSPTARPGNKIFDFPVTLNSSTQYTVTFNPGPVDTNGAGTAVTLPVPVVFTSGVTDTTSPTVVPSGRLPAPSSTSNDLRPTFSVTFSEQMGASTAGNIVAKKEGGANVCTSFVDNGTGLTFTCTPATNLEYGATYRVTVGDDASRVPSSAVAAQDSVGNNLMTSANNTWTFMIRGQAGSVTNPVVAGAGAVTATTTTGIGDITALAFTATPSPTNRNVTFDPDYTSYTVSNLPPGTATVVVRLTFQSAITGKQLYKVPSSVQFDRITEISGAETIGTNPCVFRRIDDYTIDLTIVNDGSCDGSPADPSVVDDAPLVWATPITATLGAASAAGGGGGGCSVDPAGRDASLVMTLLASLAYVGWRRRRS